MFIVHDSQQILQPVEIVTVLPTKTIHVCYTNTTTNKEGIYGV